MIEKMIARIEELESIETPTIVEKAQLIFFKDQMKTLREEQMGEFKSARETYAQEVVLPDSGKGIATAWLELSGEPMNLIKTDDPRLPYAITPASKEDFWMEAGEVKTALIALAEEMGWVLTDLT